mgnify:CR=1 FL=1
MELPGTVPYLDWRWDDLVFLLLAGVMLGSALLVVLGRDIIRSALWLILSFAALFLSVVLLQIGAGGLAPLDAIAGSSLPIRSIEDLKAELDKLCGVPARPERSREPVAVVKWVDGTVLDTVWRVG